MLLNRHVTSMHPCSIESIYQSSSKSNQTDDISFNIRDDSSYFLCGMYELSDADSQSREGGISLFKWSNLETSEAGASSDTLSSASSSGKRSNKVQMVCSKSCDGGVLDIKIKQTSNIIIGSDKHIESSTVVQKEDIDKGCKLAETVESEETYDLLIGTALSTAKAVIYSISRSSIGRTIEDDKELNTTSSTCQASSSDIKEVANIHLEEEGLFLSFDWHNDRSHPASVNKFSVSTQASSIITFQLQDDGHIQECSRYSNCHTMFGEALPAWTVFSNPFNPNILASGGDDCVCKLWDLRCADSETFSIRKRHNAGVTSGQFHPLLEHIFVTGSYDEHLRIWDHRNLQLPFVDVAMGGGVWRTKWSIVDSRSYVTCALMQGGCGIQEVRFGSSDTEASASFTAHAICQCKYSDELSTNHLSYGIDILNIQSQPTYPNSKEDGTDSDYSSSCRFTIASCSFYENIIDVWRS